MDNSWEDKRKIRGAQESLGEISVNFIDNFNDLGRQVEAFWQIERIGLEERFEGSNSIEHCRAYGILQNSTKFRPKVSQIDGFGLLYKR